MRKIIASVLAVVLVVCAFSTLSVSAAENLLAGKTYTYTTDSTSHNEDGSLMTDGKIRGVGENGWNGDLKLDGVTMEMMGTGKIIEYTFTFDAATDVDTIVFRAVRIASNRQFGTVIVNGGAPILSSSDTLTKTAIEGAPTYGDAADNQYFDITVPVALTGVTTLSIKVMTDAYVMQFDEIEAYGPAAGDAPVEESSEDASSEDVSDDSADVSDDSADVSADDSSDDDSSEDVEEIVIADPTYTVTYSVNEDGTANITVTTPEGVGNGKVLLAVSENLTLVEGSATTATGGALNVTDNGIVVSFASASTFAEGTVVISADYTVAEGAEITADDFNVPTWQLGDGDTILTTDADGDVIKVMPAEEVEESSEEESSEVVVEPEVPNTGDLGIAVFAVLAVISAGAVVVLKKKA